MNNQPLNCHIQPNTPFGAILTPQHPGQKIGDLPVAALRTLAQEHHLLVLRGFDSGFNEAEVLTRYAEQWGEIMMWPFGAVLDVKEHPDAKDHIFDSSYVPLHWDGMYKPTIPEFQLFHCVAAPSQDEGGCTTFVDTTRLLANADEALLDQWLSVSITYRIKQVVHYGGEVCSPLVVQHPNGRGLIMRYNEPPTEEKIPQPACAGISRCAGTAAGTVPSHFAAAPVRSASLLCPSVAAGRRSGGGQLLAVARP